VTVVCDLDKLRAGDRPEWKKATDQFFSIVGGLLRGRCSRITPEDIEDIAIESITKVIRTYLPTAKSPDDLERQLGRTALNAYKDWLDKLYALKRGAGPVQSLEAQPDDTEYESPSPTPSQEAEQKERSRLLDQALAQLPVKQSECLHAHYRLGLSYEEIAAEQGITMDDVAVSIHRGKKALAPILIKMGLVVRNQTEIPLSTK
jgi:RNA polymerase sigma factor (sigma-70 family)